MSKVHYFQRYTQRENVVTNNTLLLFSRLYNHSPQRFQDFLNELFEGEEVGIVVGPEITQQTGNETRKSVPDGNIYQNSFKLLIETKLVGDDQGQLIRHLQGFGSEEMKILLMVHPEQQSKEFIREVQIKIYKSGSNVKFYATTFESIIERMRDVIPEYDIEMNSVLEDYLEYCQESKLLAEEKYYMRAITAGTSLQDNLKYGVYFDYINRGFSSHAYIGLYKDKAVRAIGKLAKIANPVFDKVKGEFTDITMELGEVLSPDEEIRIMEIMYAAEKNYGWKIYRDYKFFLVDKFIETYYPKTTKYPIQKTRFFNLKTVLGKEPLPSTEEIAEQLKGEHWE